MRFIPREEKFFDYFEDLSRCIEEGLKVFLDLVECGNCSEVQIARIKEIEHEADVITHRTYEKMHKTFLTPLDREDIYCLINKMDSIIDMTEAAAARLILYKVKSQMPALLEQARVLYEASCKVSVIVRALKDMKNAPQILKMCVEINTLENAGDVILRAAMTHLFENEQDVRELIKWKEIHERIEEAIDVCEDVSNIVEGIVLKNG